MHFNVVTDSNLTHGTVSHVRGSRPISMLAILHLHWNKQCTPLWGICNSLRFK